MLCMAKVVTDSAIIADVRGRASRFVMMKYLGNVLNLIQISGAVRIWQETAMEKLSHNLARGSIRPPCGYQEDSSGKMTAIPVMARYESWNPRLVMTAGLKPSCKVRATSSVLTVDFFLSGYSFPTSLIMMKSSALTMDGPAPVINA